MNSKAVNRIVTTVLRSPLHPVLSARYLVLEFTGRKTGRRYPLPVACTRAGDRVSGIGRRDAQYHSRPAHRTTGRK